MPACREMSDYLWSHLNELDTAKTYGIVHPEEALEIGKYSPRPKWNHIYVDKHLCRLLASVHVECLNGINSPHNNESEIRTCNPPDVDSGIVPLL